MSATRRVATQADEGHGPGGGRVRGDLVRVLLGECRAAVVWGEASASNTLPFAPTAAPSKNGHFSQQLSLLRPACSLDRPNKADRQWPFGGAEPCLSLSLLGRLVCRAGPFRPMDGGRPGGMFMRGVPHSKRCKRRAAVLHCAGALEDRQTKQTGQTNQAAPAKHIDRIKQSRRNSLNG